MKKLFGTLFISFTLSFAFGQDNDIKVMVDSLQFLKTDTFNCNADLFWRIIAKKDKAIPYLIDKLTDTTQTNIKFLCKKTKLNVGEVAYFALQKIAYFPAFDVTHIQFDVFELNGCWCFFQFFFDNSNKYRYQKCVREWYAKERGNYKVKYISNKDLTDCQKKYKINEYLDWTD